MLFRNESECDETGDIDYVDGAVQVGISQPYIGKREEDSGFRR